MDPGRIRRVKFTTSWWKWNKRNITHRNHQ